MKSLFALYGAVASLLALYGLNCHLLSALFRRRLPRARTEDAALLAAFYGAQPPAEAMASVAERLPPVTTQVPIYNERHVAQRVIAAVAALQYPPGRHEIQVLDDSDDDTRLRVAAQIAALRQQGIAIRHLARPQRAGYKAGALRHGLNCARGELIAIFDADFVPPPDFLLRAVPFFLANPRLGLVQGRWAHLNREESLITRLQAMAIDGHFMVEQSARSGTGLLLNFNGTAGLLRKQAILEAGNWQADTLTEDLDLSYRLQLAGWQARYLVDLAAPAEIPGDINAFKRQQARWAKGSTQTALKLLPSLLQAPLAPMTRLQAVLHLTHYLVHPLMLVLALSALPLLLASAPVGGVAGMALGVLLLLAGASGPVGLYLRAGRALGRPWPELLLLAALMMPFGCGLALNNSRAVIEALLGRTSGFERTPKRGGARRLSYLSAPGRQFLLELLAALWCLVAVGLYLQRAQYLVGHFLFLYTAGFAFMGVLSWRHGRRQP